jgi:hypothetical protein
LLWHIPTRLACPAARLAMAFSSAMAMRPESNISIGHRNALFSALRF